jgi:hypothetical protein
MRITWRLCLAAVFVAFAFSPRAMAVDPEKPTLEDIQKELRRIGTSLEKLEGLKKDVQDVREDLNYQRMVKIPSLEQEIRGLEQQILRLNQELDRQRATSTRTSFYAGPSAPSGPTGTILLRNNYITPVTIAVDGRLYDVPPGTEMSLPRQPAGEFTYEVIGIQAPVRRTLAANRTFDITVYTR